MRSDIPFLQGSILFHLARRRGSIAPNVLLMILVLAIIVAAAGWWFGMEMPRRQRLAATVDRDLVVARADLDASNWTEAEKRFEDVLILDPGSREANMKLQDIKEHLANARGGLEIDTDPPGATVRVGGWAEKTSPATFDQLPLGKYSIRIEKEDFEPVTGELEVKENQVTQNGMIQLIPGRGKLKIDSIPEGEIFDVLDASGNDLRSGLTPAIIGLNAGHYKVKLSRPGWPDYSNAVIVKRNEETAESYEFGVAELTVKSEPAGGDITLDGKSVGKAPLVVTVPVGAHQVLASYTDCPDVKIDAYVENGKGGTATANFNMGH
jgi:hypothetical protein